MSIFTYRKRLGLTQLELAKRWRISRISLASWESGHTAPRGKLIDSILRIEGGQLNRGELLNNPKPRMRQMPPVSPPSSVNGSAHPAASKPPKDAVLEAAILEIGARSIFEFRASPKRKSWETLPSADKEPYYQRMRTLLTLLERGGFELVADRAG